jgi:hypothetical protein
VVKDLGPRSAVGLTAELLGEEHCAGDVFVGTVDGNDERGADWDGGLFDSSEDFLIAIHDIMLKEGLAEGKNIFLRIRRTA